MGLYIGGKKQKVVVNGQATAFIVPTITKGVVLKSKDGYTLADKQGVVLTAKEEKR